MSSLFCQHLCPESFPDFYRKFIQRRDSGNKRDARWARNSKIELLSNAFIWKISYPVRKARRAFNQQSRPWPAWAQKGLRKRICNEGSGPNSGAKIAFRVKLLERQVYSESRDSKISRQRSRGRKSRGTIAKASRDQLIANLTVELLMEWLSRHSFEPNHFERDNRATTTLLTEFSISNRFHHSGSLSPQTLTLSLRATLGMRVFSRTWALMHH